MLYSPVINGGFETGTLAPWVGFNATVTTGQVHQGYFKADLTGGGLNSYIYQYVPVTPDINGQLVLSLAKDSALPSPAVSVTVQYYDEVFAFLGYGAIQVVQEDGLPLVTNQTWKGVYALATTVPQGATMALIVINALPGDGTSAVSVDDVELVFV